jgi:hypothetical protein
MNHWVRSVALFAIVMMLLVPVVWADEMKSEPAWCGSSWDPGAVDAAGKVVERGGSNFGKCVPTKKMAGGKDAMVPTHPARPARQVTIQRDAQGHLVGGTMQSGKFVPVPRRISPKR